MINFLLDNSVVFIIMAVVSFFFYGLYCNYFKINRQMTNNNDFNLIKSFMIVQARKNGRNWHRDVMGEWSKYTIEG